MRLVELAGPGKCLSVLCIGAHSDGNEIGACTMRAICSTRKPIATSFVEFNGKPVASVKRRFKNAVGLARLTGNVTPHTLSHTAATCLMQRGVPIWEAPDSWACPQRC